MGREVRMVAVGWEHPKYPDDHYESHLRGRYIPLHQNGFDDADKEWNEGYAKWQEGLVQSYGDGEKWRLRTKDDGATYTLYSGPRPSPDDYMPQWPDGTANLLMMYEDTSEGTPISPAFDTPELLAKWLADTGASSFGGSTATYEQWLSTCKRGWAMSAVMEVGPNGSKMMSGVEAMADH